MSKLVNKAARTGVKATARYAKAKIAAAVSVAVVAAAAGGLTVAYNAGLEAVSDTAGTLGIELPGSTTAEAKTSTPVAHKWSYKTAPNYYTVRGKAQTTSIKAGKVKYSKLDSLGRTQAVTAKVTYKMVADSAGWREDMPAEADTISGWGHNTMVSVSLSNGRTYNGYAFNRSHLLADSLGGHAIKRNLITGTRMQNVGNNDYSNPGGMAYTETLARNYLYSHKDGWVYYRATPVYKGNELVARSVYVDIQSDDGSINMRVEVYNAMRGYTVDYKTGTIAKAG